MLAHIAEVMCEDYTEKKRLKMEIFLLKCSSELWSKGEKKEGCLG